MDSILNKNYEEMGITDDYMFCKVFTDNPDPTK